MSSETVRDPYPASIGLEEFARWTRSVLEPFGFTRDNALALVGVCRDELMFATEHALYEHWGPPFDLSSLGALVFLGRSGMAAAAGHAPGLDGRRRFVAFVLPHIGVGDDGTAGAVERAGLDETSNACGALIELRRQLDAGPVDLGFDPSDPEMSMIRMQLVPSIDGPRPSLTELTELARQCATAEVVALCGELKASAEADVAVISGVVVHRSDRDQVAVRDAWVSLGSDPARVPLV